MQHFIKKAAALALAMVMALSLASVAFAADFEDMPTDWSADAVQSAVTNGLLSGKDGLIAAADNLTRAEMATIITRAFNAEVEDDISFTDVKTDAWYKSAVAKAVHMGAMNGSGSNGFTPAASVTRQEVFVVLARVLKLADGSAEDLAAFSDADKTASWAVPAVAALVKAGYVSGSNGALNPTGNITRAEFAQVMYNIFHNAYLNEAATYEEVDGDNVIISIANVTLKGVEVKGDVVVADGVGDGDVFLEDVTIGGRLVVRGGGMNSIHVKGKTTVDNVVMAKVDGNVRVVVAEESTVGTVTVESGKASTDVRVEGTVEKLVVNDAASTVVLADATVASVEVAVDGATVSLAGKTTVAEMTVPEGVSKTTVNAEPGTEITKLETAGDVFINQEDVIKDCNDETKINPEQPEESADPSASTAPGTDDKAPEDVTGHVHAVTTATWVNLDNDSHYFTCTCGEVIKKPHDWGDPAENGTISCKANGCNATKVDAEPVESVTPGDGACADGNHNWVAMTAEELTAASKENVAVSCVTDGKTWYKCSKQVEAPVQPPVSGGDNTGAGGNDTPVSRAATPCTAVRCVTTPATGHSYDAGTVTTAPTCKDKGVKTFTCTKCDEETENHTKTVELPATNKHTATGAIQSDDTKHWFACATEGCTAKVNEADHVITFRAVMEEDGSSTNHSGTCSVCKKVVTAAHDTAGTDGACSKCGYKAEEPDTPTHTHGDFTYDSTGAKGNGKHTEKCGVANCPGGAGSTKQVDCTFNKEAQSPTGKCTVCESDCPNKDNHSATPCTTCGVATASAPSQD